MVAASSATPFACGIKSFVIVQNLAEKSSEIVQSERRFGADGEIHRHETTSSVAAPLIVLAETRHPV
jgi:hypothetical protein